VELNLAVLGHKGLDSLRWDVKLEHGLGEGKDGREGQVVHRHLCIILLLLIHLGQAVPELVKTNQRE
jgi:hypothetical protein